MSDLNLEEIRQILFDGIKTQLDPELTGLEVSIDHDPSLERGQVGFVVVAHLPPPPSDVTVRPRWTDQDHYEDLEKMQFLIRSVSSTLNHQLAKFKRTCCIKREVP